MTTLLPLTKTTMPKKTEKCQVRKTPDKGKKNTKGEDDYNVIIINGTNKHLNIPCPIIQYVK